MLLGNRDKSSDAIFYIPGYTKYTDHIILVVVSTTIHDQYWIFTH